jgi:hypothetical protein
VHRQGAAAGLGGVRPTTLRAPWCVGEGEARGKRRQSERAASLEEHLLCSGLFFFQVVTVRGPGGSLSRRQGAGPGEARCLEADGQGGSE